MALVIPNAMINVKMAVFEEIPKSCSASCGHTVCSNPIIPPTKALITTKSENYRQFSLRPNCKLSIYINILLKQLFRLRNKNH